MVCDMRLKPRQSQEQRREELRKRMNRVQELLAQRKLQVKVGKQGAITFVGLSDEDRDGMTDACIYRSIMRTGSAAAKQAIMRAEQISGVKVNKSVLHAGVHSHDGGQSWSAH